MEWVREFIKSIIAGIMISIGCIINLSCDNKYIGAILFSIGLISILLFKLSLYTGKVCFIPMHKPSYILKVILILIGNIIGCGVIGILFPITPANICLSKMLYEPQMVLIKSAICGLLIYIAVDSYNKCKNFLITILCIAVFILSGQIHVVADTFYFISANVLNIETLKYLILATIGNAIGGMLIPFLYIKKLID